LNPNYPSHVKPHHAPHRVLQIDGGMSSYIARTYDPAVLGRGNPAADPAAAAAWYNMATALSDVETTTRRTPLKGEH